MSEIRPNSDQAEEMFPKGGDDDGQFFITEQNKQNLQPIQELNS